MLLEMTPLNIATIPIKSTKKFNSNKSFSNVQIRFSQYTLFKYIEMQNIYIRFA